LRLQLRGFSNRSGGTHPEVREVGLAYSSALYGAGQVSGQRPPFLEGRCILASPGTRWLLWDIFRQRRSMQHYKEGSETLVGVWRPSSRTIRPSSSSGADLFERLSQYPEAERVLTRLCELEPASAYRRYRLGYGITLWFREPDKLRSAEASLRRGAPTEIRSRRRAQYSVGLSADQHETVRRRLVPLSSARSGRGAGPTRMRCAS